MEFFTPNVPAPANTLGMALVLCSSTPLVLLDGAFMVRAASGTFCRTFGLDSDAVIGRELFTLGAGEWDLPQLRSLLNGTLAGDVAIDAYELDLVRDSGVQHLVLNAQRLNYAEAEEVRLVLAISDVSEAHKAAKQVSELLREKDDLVRRKQVLLQELQHRVANSLQIIASVLMQSARKVQSEEARTHLNDAHHRVMSIATLQKQLAETTAGEVALRPYFTDLCNSIGASMIADQSRIKITPTITDSKASSEVSVSLGLIVTELVINALKHAFPDKLQFGNIGITYAANGSAWELTVTDDGVGRSANPVPGLGTGIVEALAKQLKAIVEISDAQPGTIVTVVHDKDEAPASLRNFG